MSCTTTTSRFQLRRGTETQWATSNPALLLGEPAYSTDTNQLKIGDGFTQWSNLPYINLAGLPGAVGTPTTLQSTITITSATGRSGTQIFLSSIPSGLVVGNSVTFNPLPVVNAGGGGTLRLGTPYYVLSINPTGSLYITVGTSPLATVPF
jgi:Major tropism determinant N-terminal domain